MPSGSLPLMGAVPPRKKLARATLRGESRPKFLGAVNLGRVVERAFQLAGLTKDQARLHMEYADGSTVSKWIANEEPPNLARLWSVDVLRIPLVQALAEESQSIEVKTLIEIRRRQA